MWTGGGLRRLPGRLFHMTTATQRAPRKRDTRKTDDGEKERVNIIVARSLWDRVRDEADADDRKISSYVSRVLIAHFESLDRNRKRRKR